MDIAGYDEWKTKVPEDDSVSVGECAQCMDELYAGDDAYHSEDDDVTVCGIDCLARYVSKNNADWDDFKNIELEAL